MKTSSFYNDNGIRFELEPISPSHIIATAFPVYGVHNTRDLAQSKIDVALEYKILDFRVTWLDLPWKPLVTITMDRDSLKIEAVQKERIANIFIPGSHDTHFVSDTKNHVGITEDALEAINKISIFPTAANKSNILIEIQKHEQTYSLMWKGKLVQHYLIRKSLPIICRFGLGRDDFRII